MQSLTCIYPKPPALNINITSTSCPSYSHSVYSTLTNAAHCECFHSVAGCQGTCSGARHLAKAILCHTPGKQRQPPGLLHTCAYHSTKDTKHKDEVQNDFLKTEMLSKDEVKKKRKKPQKKHYQWLLATGVSEDQVRETTKRKTITQM